MSVWYHDKLVALQAVGKNGLALLYASQGLRGDKEVVLEAVREDGVALQYASADLLADKDVVLAAVRKSGFALQYASRNLREDKDVVLEAVREFGCALKHASENLRADKDVVLEAAWKDGFALEYASDNLREDKDFVLKAVRQHGFALRHASAELRADIEVVRHAVLQIGNSLRYADRALHADKALVLLAARNEDPEAVVPMDMLYWMQGAGVDETTFRLAVDCPIAVKGEDCPITTVSLSLAPAECDIDGNGRRPENIRCSCILMSGFTVECAPQQCGATVDDLARTVVDNLPDHIQTSSKRIFIIFNMGAECEPIAVTPWDWNRSLVDFLPKRE